MRAPIDLAQIEARKEALFKRKQSTPYCRQKSSLEKEFASFLQNLSPTRDLQTATPDDVVSFLIWKDVRGKTKVHLDSCPAFGTKKSLKCACPTRLAFGTVDSLIGKLRAIFATLGRGSDDSGLPGYGNPAASRVVKDYLTSVREEQLQARISPSQAEPFFLTDLVAVAEHICSRLKEPGLTPKQIFILARDQAFLKVLFFAGDRATDLGRVKTKEILYFPQKEGILFNHIFTKTLRDGSNNLFALKRCESNNIVCPVTAIEVYVSICDLLKVPVRQGYLFRPLNASGEILAAPFDSSAAQARLSGYVSSLLHVFGSRNITLHGLRSGCAISLALAGSQMPDILSHVGWKTSKTAEHYIKLNRVLCPGGASDALANISLDLHARYQEQNKLTGFTSAFC